jgi:xylulokinase
MSDLLLGLDLGTGSAKVVAYDAKTFESVARAGGPYPVRAPRPGWAESDPSDWERTLTAAVSEVLASGSRLAAVGLSGQMHGVVLADSAGEPVRPAVLWADGRATGAIAVYQSLREGVRQRLANPVVPGMAGPILHWMTHEEPETYGRARWALQPKDWLRMRLTGRAGAEPSDASATLLWSPAVDRWDIDVVAALGLRSELLAPSAPSDQQAGLTTGAFGVPSGVPVAYGAGDTPCAALGGDLIAAGDAQLSVGTGGQILIILDRPVPDPTLRTHLYRTAAPTGWYAMAAIQSAGLTLERVWRMLGITWPEAYAFAAQTAPGADGLTFVPHLSGERTPYIDATIRGGWVGLSLHHERRHLVRAAFEGVAFALRQALDALRDAGHRPVRLTLAGGGSIEPMWRQMLADVLGLPLIPNDRQDTSARGAALLAARAAGLPTPDPQPPRGTATDPDDTTFDAYVDAYHRFRMRSPLR